MPDDIPIPQQASSQEVRGGDDIEEAQVQADHEKPPDGGYGWVVVAAVFWVNVCTWGINGAYGVFLDHYLTTNQFPGATPLDYAFIGGLSISMSMLIAPVTNLLVRATSTRAVMFLGLLCEVGALVGASYAKSIGVLFFTQGILFGWGLGFLFTASVGTLSQWFGKKRSVANGITSAGSGTGGIIFSISVRAMIAKHGSPWALRIVAIVAGVVNLVCTLLIKDRNKAIQPSYHPFDLKLCRRYEVWLLLGWAFTNQLGYVIVLYSLPNFSTSLGLSAQQGATLSAILSAGMTVGRPSIGLLSDIYGRINIAGTMTFLTGLFCFAIWIPARNFGVTAFFAVLAGAVCGVFWGTAPPVTAEVVGLKELPSGLSLVWLATVLPTTFSEVIGLYLRQPGWKNQYLPSQIFAGGMYFLAAGFMYLLRAWKLGEIEREKEKEKEGGSEVEKGTDGGEEKKPGEVVDGKENTLKNARRRWRSANKWWRYAVV